MTGGFQKCTKPARSKKVQILVRLLRAGLRKINYAENEVPQPQPPVAFGFSKVKPEPIILVV